MKKFYVSPIFPLILGIVAFGVLSVQLVFCNEYTGNAISFATYFGFIYFTIHPSERLLLKE